MSILSPASSGFNLYGLQRPAPAPTPAAERRPSTTSAWLLGHAFGLHCDVAVPPDSYTPAEVQAFEDGRSVAEFRRWVASKGHMPAPADELNEFLAALHRSDHDAQPDPFDVEVWTIPDWEWRAVSIGLVRDPDDLIHDAERTRVLGHRA